MKIIILSLSKYGEKDAIVNAISEDEYLTFKAHGVTNPTSKNAVINNHLAVLDAVITTNKTGTKSLKECSPILLLDYSQSDLIYLATINTILEATNKMLSDDEKHLAFPYLEKALFILKDTKYPLFLLIAYLAKMIKLSGASFEINHCVGCGSKKDIVAFSFFEGGYICKNCLDENIDTNLTTYQLLMIRLLCGSKEFDFTDMEYNEGELLLLLKRFIFYIEDVVGVVIGSTKLIIS